MRHSAAVALVALSCTFAAVRPAASASTAAPTATAKPPGGVRITLLIAGKAVGASSCSWIKSTGECDFEFNDRGVGPKLHESVVIDAAGLPTRLEITGTDRLRRSVHETFTRTAATASWKNQAENGSRASTDAAFYVPFNELPVGESLLAQALTAAPRNTLALLPDGEARLEVLGERRVTVPGSTMVLTHVALYGLDLSPYYVWLDADKRLFADTGEYWVALMRKGFESLLGELHELDRQARAQHFKDLGKGLAHHPTGGLVIHGARLFDPATGVVSPGTTVVIVGRRIQAVGADGAVPEPPGAERIAAKGRMVLPGLWDMHTHLAASDGLLHIAAGVTSVRDLANEIDQLRNLKTSWESGEEVGPHVHRAGFIDSPGHYEGPTKVLVDNEKDAVAWVDRYADMGYEQIKIYGSLKPELVPPIVAEAHRRGLRVSGHIPAFMTAEQCVRLGFDEIQHADSLFANFYGKEVPDMRTKDAILSIRERAAGFDLKSRPIQDFIRLLHDRAVVSDPTLNIFENLILSRPGEIRPSLAAVSDRLPATVRRGLLAGGEVASKETEDLHRRSFAAMEQMIGELYRNGVQIVAGTDSMAGFAYHRELELYAAAGIPAPAVLRIATLDAARVMKADAAEGSVAPGKIADLILVDGDPTLRISDIRKVQIVIKDGVVYDSDELYRALGIRPLTGSGAGVAAHGLSSGPTKSGGAEKRTM